MSQQLRPFKNVPPGRILVRELDARQWNADQLSQLSGLPIETVTALIENTQPITGDIADKLATAFGISATFWSNLQKEYDIWNEPQTTASSSRPATSGIAALE